MFGRLRVFAALISLAVSFLIATSARSVADPASPRASQSNAQSDAQSAPDESSALAIAVQFHHPVTVDSDTTETGLVAAQPDGSFHLTESTLPSRVRRNGVWTPVDLSLAAEPGGMLAPAASATPVKFSAGGSGPLAMVQAPSGGWLSETWPNGPLPAPTVTADSATYPDVLPGVDLRLSATAMGMSEVLIIKNAAAAADPGLSAVRFGVDDGSMTTTEVAGGAMVTTASGQGQQLVSAPPTWWDSSIPGASASGPGDTGVPLPLANSDTPGQISLNAAAALASSSVQYPAFVDPPFTGVRVNYTFTDKAYPTQSYWNGAGASDSYFHVGYIDAANSPDDGKAHTTRSYWSMALDGLAGKHIVSAALDTFEEKAYSCTSYEVDLYTSATVSASTTWNNQPAPGTYVDKAVTAHGASGCAAAPVGFNAAAPVQAAADAGSTRLYLMMKAYSETTDYGWKKFDNDPTLEISYQSPPSVPAGRSVSGCYVQCSEPILTHRNQPTITAYSTGDAGSYDYTFRVYSGHSSSPTTLATSAAVTNVPAGSVASWVVTTVAANHALYDGDFEYEARACIYTTNVCGGWSSYVTFTVDTTPPASPTATSSDFQLVGSQDPPPPTRVGNEGVPGQVTIQPNGSTDVYAYVYSPQSSLSEAAIPACGAAADVITNCSLAADLSLTVSITPTEFTSNLSLLAIDRAGNISRNAATYTYYPNGTLANDPQHAWVDSASALGSSSVADWSNAVSPQSMVLHGGTTWATPAAQGPYLGHSYNEALSFDGATGTEADAATSDVTLDVTHSATMAVWANPATTGSGPNQTVFSQDGPSSSGFYLQMSGQHWRMCMPRAGTPVSSDCTAITDPATAVTPNSWTLLVGVWDAPQRVMTLYVITDQATFSTSLDHTSVATAATGQVVLGRAMASGVHTDAYTGQAADPLIYNVALGVSQLAALQGNLPADLGA